MLWGLSLQAWQTAVFWLWAVAAITGGTAVVAFAASSVISYYISEETQTLANREIAQANSIAGSANEAAEIAKVKSLELQKDIEIAIVEQKQAQIRIIELEGFAKAVRPRKISTQNIEDLFDESLKYQAKIGKITVSSIRDPEAVTFAQEILTAIKIAGWEVDGLQLIDDPIAPGVTFIGKSAEIERIFKIIDVEYFNKDKNVRDNEYKITVGSKSSEIRR